MKQYIMGMLTGASLILCAVMFIGASDNNSNNGKYQMTDTDSGLCLLDTATGQVYNAKNNTSLDYIRESGSRGFLWDEASNKPKYLFKPWNVNVNSGEWKVPD